MSDASAHDEYRSPMSSRYASEGMRRLFSERRRIREWRRLWVWLAEAEHELGLPVTQAQVEAMRAKVDAIDFANAAQYETRFRHDVMAHVHAFGDAAPEARGVIHLGATSCYVTDNADAILVREGLERIEAFLADAISALAAFAEKHADLPCLAYTHFQPAQPTTVGKRACLWIQDFVDDLENVARARERVPFLGSKGTTGTQASFLALFGGNAEKAEELDLLVAQKAGFDRPVAVSGQTYSRKADYSAVAALGGVAVSVSKFANDVRLLSGHGELSEPFGGEQIGSSAMPYKQNPMRSERANALARHLLALVGEAGATAAAQWLERTLDDSASRRIFLPESFLTADAILRLVTDVARGLVVHEGMVRARVGREAPFLASEDVLMHASRAGGDRQALHERIRVHSRAAREALREGAERNDLVDRLRGDPSFARVKDEIAGLLDPARLTGLSSRQCRRFLAEVVAPAIAPYRARLGQDAAIRV